jgi:hypothetical protein
MLQSVPLFVSIVFIITVLITAGFFLYAVNYSYKSRSKSMPVWIIFVLLAWLAFQGALAARGFYLYTESMPPRFTLAVAPALILIIILFATSSGKKFIDHLPLTTLTYIHTVRILVEIVLYWLFLSKAIPEVMTFAGHNFDVVAGITAPAIGLLYLKKKMLTDTVVLVWNVLCILLLTNIVILAILSAPFPFQQLAFDRPNIAVLHFPFVWLPCFIVPVILFSHLASIRILIKKRE